MLVLSCKVNESLRIRVGDVVIDIMNVMASHGVAKFGITAPKTASVRREKHLSREESKTLHDGFLERRKNRDGHDDASGPAS